VELLTIGAFARASRPSPKALRLYDSLGLLRTAHVDEVSGYRFYRPDQLERARLVAWLRRLGMPLARIQVVCDLAADAPDQAAGQVAAYWAETEAELASRRNLATYLISYLSGKDTAMPETQRALTIRYTARTDIGRRRDRNQDTAFAGGRLRCSTRGRSPLKRRTLTRNGRCCCTRSAATSGPSRTCHCMTRGRATVTCCAQMA
jgi:PPM family protein phosphatase